ncbi:hypothetical protein [Methylomicrobium lacus]|uniref:hypothetical protein n=1 Tax=Methylomicrobium lacus TaxID=136992 RepID=UPI0004AFE338|nr:hypothetical protein [Methylomicrobium lacus]
MALVIAALMALCGKKQGLRVLQTLDSAALHRGYLFILLKIFTDYLNCNWRVLNE